MNFFRKLERKFGRFAIPNLMYYIIMMYAAGFVMSLFNPYFYVQYLALDAAAILRGQVWRIVTFLVCPPQSGVLFALLAMYLYYSIGSTLERVWGTFRFNMFFFMGVLGHIIAAFLVYGVTGFSVPMSPYYLNSGVCLHLPGDAVPSDFHSDPGEIPWNDVRSASGLQFLNGWHYREN